MLQNVCFETLLGLNPWYIKLLSYIVNTYMYISLTVSKHVHIEIHVFLINSVKRVLSHWTRCLMQTCNFFAQEKVTRNFLYSKTPGTLYMFIRQQLKWDKDALKTNYRVYEEYFSVNVFLIIYARLHMRICVTFVK